MCLAQFAILHHLSQIMWGQRIKYIIWGKEKQWKNNLLFLHTTSLQSVCTFSKIRHMQTHTQMNVSRSLARLNLHIDWVCWKRWTSIAASLYFAEIKSLSTMQSYLIIFFPESFFHYILFFHLIVPLFISLFVLLYHITSIVISSFLPTYLNYFL